MNEKNNGYNKEMERKKLKYYSKKIKGRRKLKILRKKN